MKTRSARSGNHQPQNLPRKCSSEDRPAMGYRYALHVKRLTGKPDIVLVSRRKVVFVHGCFWHNHTCRHGSKSPTTNSEYWDLKRKRNALRDREPIEALREDDWKVLVIWECWTRSSE